MEVTADIYSQHLKSMIYKVFYILQSAFHMLHSQIYAPPENEAL